MTINFWNYISSIGVNNNYDDLLTRKIKLTNRFSVIAIIVFLFSGINNYFLGDIFSALLIESLALLCILGFYFNKKKFHRVTTSFLFSITTLAVFYFDSYSGILSGTYLFHFPIVLAIAFIFDYREDRIVMFLHLLLIAILLCINMFTDYSLFRSNFITDDKRYQMFMFNLLFSVISVSFFVYLMMQNNSEERVLYHQRIKERELAEIIIKDALAEKDILLAELHHRVKNNLAIISGLFNLKLSDTLPEEAKNVLIESRDRVRSMALIHNKLYKSQNLKYVNIEEYIKELIVEINASYPSVSNTVTVNTDINNVLLDINTAVPCGLILNEALTNCYKHAFSNQPLGIINIVITYTNHQFKMIIKDNGVGLLPENARRKSLGITVIEALTEQLEGHYSLINDNGTTFELTFRLDG